MKIFITGLLVFFIFINQPNAQQKDENPLLSESFWKAATFNDVDLAIANGHNVNGKNYRGDTPITYAIEYTNNPDIIDLLAANGADLNYQIQTYIGMPSPICYSTPLVCAIYLNKKDIVESLIAKGADVNLGHPIEAAYNHATDFEIIDLIIANGGKSNSNEHPLIRATRNNTNENFIIKILKENPPKEILDEALLKAAISNKNPKIIKAIIEYANNKQVTNKNKENILMLASKYNTKDVVLEIIKQGIDLNAQNSSGKTALMFAFENLIDAINHKENYNKGLLAIDGPFDYSSFDRDIKKAKELISLLIENGADINIRDKKEMTPIMNLDSEMLKELNILNFNFNPKDKEGISSLAKNLCAKKTRYTDASRNESQFEHSIRTFASKGIKDKDENDKTLLMEASKFCPSNDLLIKFLIKKYKNVNATDKDGRTALMYADKTSVVKELIKNGAKVDLQDNNGKTALFYAIDNDNSGTFRILIDHNASIKLKDKNGLNITQYIKKHAPNPKNYSFRVILGSKRGVDFDNE